ncbi:hypothetical protein TNCV_2869242 [Trichonephila clavipes]|nr:hypothetical protein TNCV_2869242 [Trichonephila clavipes]
MWEIVNPYDTDQENGTELWNYCIVVGPGQTLYILSMDPHIGLDGNEIADSLAKPVTTDTLLGNTCLFAELSSIKRMELSALRTIPLCSPLRILFSDEAHFWLNGYVNKQNCRIWSEADPQVYVETPLHPEKLTVWGALWAGGILLQKR